MRPHLRRAHTPKVGVTESLSPPALLQLHEHCCLHLYIPMLRAAKHKYSPMPKATAASLHLGQPQHSLSTACWQLLNAAFGASTAPGQKVPPHLRIVELQHPVERSAVPARSRRELNLMVFLRKGRKPVVFTLTGSSYEGMPALQKYHHTVKGKEVEYVKMSAVEYVDCVKKALPLLAGAADSADTRGATRGLWLLQDKAKPHTALFTRDYAANRKPTPLQIITLPTDSPDLTPCDSSFFAAAKRRWRRACAQGQFTWEEKVKQAFDAIMETKPEPFIDEMRLRWKACKAARGWHIEQELAELKE